MRNPEPRLRVEDLEDDQLVTSAAQGDREAFEELVRRHQHQVYGLAMKLTGDRHLAADVAQEALIRAWKALPTFRGEAAFGTWLHRITVNVAWTLRRRNQRHRGVELELAEPRLEADQIGHPERAGETSDLRKRLDRALARLTPSARQVVILKDVQGWSHAEIAESLGITVTAAKVRLHRARATLQEHLGEAS